MALPEPTSKPSEQEPARATPEIWEPFAALRRDMEQRFADLWRGFGLGTPALTGQTAMPRIDVSETDAEVKIEAELPGVEEKDVEILLEDRRLTIRGEQRREKEEKKPNFHVIERARGSFARSIMLPFEAKPDQVKASFAKGLLTVTVPKPPEVKAKTKRIPISGA